eukprot:gene47629-64715_t
MDVSWAPVAHLARTAAELDREGDHSAAGAARGELRRVAVEGGMSDGAVRDLLLRA